MPALVDRPASSQRRFRLTLQPPQLLILSFASVIAIGTLLLWTPAASTGERLNLIDAFFLATSATCVTGLAPFDIAARLSLFGQIVLLSCVQVGGLGLMTLTTVFVAMMGKRVAISERVALEECFHHGRTGQFGRLILHIVVATLLIESAGGLLLFLGWTASGHIPQWTTRAYHALFQSVSAFCNAGFALYSDNLSIFARDGWTQAVTTGLIIAGGIGFLVTLDVREYLLQLYLEKTSRMFPGRVDARRTRRRLSVHTKLVLSVTGFLLSIGTVSYYMLERHGLFAEMTTLDAWWNAWFCSVTARTAGFSTIDYAQLSGPALMCTMALMFIGASPGSTGGGIKTSTFGVLIAHALFRARGHIRLHLFGRSIPEETIGRSHAIVVSAIAVVVLGASIVIAAEAQRYGSAESRELFLPVLFETISAFGTVGLSMNFTPTLTALGKFVIALVMFIGRVGPLTVGVTIAARSQRGKYQYAEENLMVG